jgi:hypothetical protein
MVDAVECHCEGVFLLLRVSIRYETDNADCDICQTGCYNSTTGLTISRMKRSVDQMDQCEQPCASFEGERYEEQQRAISPLTF